MSFLQTTGENIRTLLDALEDPFHRFGGGHTSSRRSGKALVTRDLRLQRGGLVRNLEFLRFAHHRCFTPPACPTVPRAHQIVNSSVPSAISATLSYTRAVCQ